MHDNPAQFVYLPVEQIPINKTQHNNLEQKCYMRSYVWCKCANSRIFVFEYIKKKYTMYK